MPLGKGAPFNILTDYSDIIAVNRQRSTSHSLCCSPIKFIFLDGFQSMSNVHTSESLVRFDSLRDFNWGLDNIFKDFRIYTCVLRILSPLAELHRSPLVSQTAATFELRILDSLEGGLILLALLELLFEIVCSLINNLLILTLLKRAFLNKLVSVGLRNWFHIANYFVHTWLGKGRLIHFIMSVLSESNHVENDIFSKFLPVTNCKLGYTGYTFNIVSVYSNNRDPKRLYNVWREWETTTILWICCKTNLVVSDEMDGSICSEFR
jgi:hypothetical protein